MLRLCVALAVLAVLAVLAGLAPAATADVDVAVCAAGVDLRAGHTFPRASVFVGAGYAPGGSPFVALSPEAYAARCPWSGAAVAVTLA